MNEDQPPRPLTLRAPAPAYRAKAFVFQDPESRALLRRIEQVAPSDATVLVTGETGTGKELVARHLHALSRRSDAPFVGVNCGALTESLVESELFGHERGAFTGATSTKIGWFEAAHGGTLFLDEIAELSAASQVKLLRVLQEGEVVRLGSRETLSVDVRLIAATNVPLQQAVLAGRFRADLYYRLNIAPLVLSALRQRTGDILPLAEHFLAIYGKRLEIAQPSIASDAVDALLAYAWPGNIRELENVIHRALLVCNGGRVTRADLLLPEAAAESETDDSEPAQSARSDQAHTSSGPPGEALQGVLQQLFESQRPQLFHYIEEMTIRLAHEFCGGNQLKTARLLGLSRNVVRARLLHYGAISGSLRPPNDDQTAQ